MSDASGSEFNPRTIISAATAALGGPDFTPEQYALVQDAYDAEARKYHGVSHLQYITNLTEQERRDLEIFARDDSGKLAGLVTLAGIYHDIVYTQSEAMPESLGGILKKYVMPLGNGIYMPSHATLGEHEQRTLEIVSAIFGVGLRSPLKRSLQNEFLSALVAADQMREMGYDDKAITQVVAMIEGTIPFRPVGRFDALAARFEKANTDLELGFTEGERDHTIKAAVLLANKDVYSLAGKGAKDHLARFRAFIQDTWRLLPEFNEPLQKPDYTATDFRLAMQRRHKFYVETLGGRDAKVFHAYQGYPDETRLAELHERELEIRHATHAYLMAKTVSAAIVEAIAVVTKGPQAMNAMMGDRGDQSSFTAFADPARKVEAMEAGIVADVLADGRGEETGFDRDRSPIGAYLYKRLVEPGLNGIFTLVEEYLPEQGKITPEACKAFLEDACPIMGRGIFENITQALATVARNNGNRARAEEILALPDQFLPRGPSRA